MPDSPITAKFLDEEDKLVAIERYLILPFVSTGSKFTRDLQTSHEPTGHRKPRMEMGTREGSMSGPEVLDVVFIDGLHLVSATNSAILPSLTRTQYS